MEAGASPEAPRARVERLVVRSIGEETVVYDQGTHRAHCLNVVARFVLDGCDGRMSSTEIARALREGQPGIAQANAETLVDDALEQLGRADLIEGLPTVGARTPGRSRSRRATIQALGLASLAPLVLSLTAPTPAEAQTCLPRDRPCTSSRQCCPSTPCCRSQGPPGTPPTCRPGGGQCLP